MKNPLFKGLNPKQKEAVKHHDGAMLVKAGAGSGKTRILTRRIANLVLTYHVSPGSIVALTFTNKATTEMDHRIHKLLGHQADNIHISTFHALGRSILKQENTEDQMDDFTPIDDSTRLELIREIMARIQGISIHHVGLLQASNVLADISLAKNNLETPHSDHKNLKMQPGELEYKVYDQYEKELKANHETDIDDDIMLPVILLKRYSHIRHYYQSLFQYINVDEYQDTNKAQYELIRLLDGKSNNLFAVGDENQSIYGWRGADVRNIESFDRDYPLSTIIKMKANYRSTGNIIGVANSVIKNNHGETNYKANVAVNKMGPKVIRCVTSTTQVQAEYVVNQIIKKKRKFHLNYSDFAILFRQNKQAKVLEYYLLKNHLKYQFVSNNNFFSQNSVQDILGYLYVINDLHSGQSLSRIINTPKRGITHLNYQRLMNYVDSTKSKLSYVINNIYLVKGISKRGQHAILKFYKLIQKWRKECDNKNSSVANIIYSILDDTGYMKVLNKKLEDTDNLTDKASIRADIDGLKGVIHVAKQFDHKHADESVKTRVISLAHFISVNSLPSSVTGINSKSRVGLMSVHASKGLEFPVVFIVGMNDGIFPDTRSRTPSKLKEERRIAYVGMTRAEKELYLLDTTFNYVRGKFKPLKPSIFLKEANPKYMKFIQVKKHKNKLFIKDLDSKK